MLVQSVAASDFEALYNDGVAARLNGAHVEAADLLSRALSLSPQDPDALVQMGYTQLALDEAMAAVEFFIRASDLAPEYGDAQRGLARAYLQAGDPKKSIQIYRQTQERSPEAVDWLGLGDAYRAASKERDARAAYKMSLRDPITVADARQRIEDPEFLPYRLDLTFSGSKLNNSADAWRNVGLRLGMKASADASVSVGVERAHRFGLSDFYLNVQVDHRISRLTGGYVIIGGAGRGNFRPDAALELGMVARIAEESKVAGSTDLLLSLRQDLYGDEAITTVKAGIDQILDNGRANLSAQMIRTQSNKDKSSTGWAVNGKVMVSDEIGIVAGYSDVPDTDGGRLTDAETSFAGISIDYGAVSRLGLIYSIEERSTGIKRKTLSMTHSFRF